MLKEDDHYSDDENDIYITPSFPIASFNKKLQEQQKKHMAELPPDMVIDYVQTCMDESNMLTRKLQNWAKDSHYSELADYLKIPYDRHSTDIFDWLDLLITIAQHAERMFDIDKQAMRELAHQDPGAYAQALICRRDNCHPRDNVGGFVENHLRIYLFPRKHCTMPRAEDHKAWFTYIEEHRPYDPIRRVTPRLNDSPQASPPFGEKIFVREGESELDCDPGQTT